MLLIARQYAEAAELLVVDFGRAPATGRQIAGGISHKLNQFTLHRLRMTLDKTAQTPERLLAGTPQRGFQFVTIPAVNMAQPVVAPRQHFGKQ